MALLFCFEKQEILQVDFDQELWGSELERRRKPGVSAQHHDGPEEVLQPPVPLPCRLHGESKNIVTWT